MFMLEPVLWLGPCVCLCLLVALLSYRVGKSRGGSLLKETQDARYALEGESATNARKAQEYFETIESVLKERDLWRTWYFEMASGAGTAQSLLMTERERLVGQLISSGLKPHTNPQVDQVVALCSEQHQNRVLPTPVVHPEGG